jgi:hypothetical protein
MKNLLMSGLLVIAGFASTVAIAQVLSIPIANWPPCAVTSWSQCGLKETNAQCKACCSKWCTGGDVTECKAICDEVVGG